MDKEIYIHPIFNDLLNNFRFFIVGINMMSMPDFQKAIIKAHKGEKSELEISVKYDNLKYFKYDIKDVLASFNKETGLKLIENKVHSNIINLLNFQARQVAISLFNILENSEFNNIVNKQMIFKFVKHIRNGAAHNNKFNFDSKTISELPVEWRDKIIIPSLHKTEVFNKFLTPADLILLTSDLSKIIKS